MKYESVFKVKKTVIKTTIKYYTHTSDWQHLKNVVMPSIGEDVEQHEIHTLPAEM